MTSFVLLKRFYAGTLIDPFSFCSEQNCISIKRNPDLIYFTSLFVIWMVWQQNT